MKTVRGFTLIEMMIVVALIGVLTAIAVPQYNDYVKRSRIQRAVATLSDMRVKMEQYFQDNRTYVGACTAGTAAPPPPTDNTSFTFDCGTPTATTYTLTANGDGTGKSGMTGFVYTVNQSNQKSTTLSSTAGKASAGWSGSGNACWVINRGGDC